MTLSTQSSKPSPTTSLLDCANHHLNTLAVLGQNTPCEAQALVNAQPHIVLAQSALEWASACCQKLEGLAHDLVVQKTSVRHWFTRQLCACSA